MSTKLSPEQLAEIEKTAHGSTYRVVPAQFVFALLGHCTALEEELKWVKAVNAELFPYQERAVKAEKELKAAQEENGRYRRSLAQVNDFRAQLVEVVRGGSDGVGGDFEVCEYQDHPLDCPMCNGEACNLCGARLSNTTTCEHDVIERHQEPEGAI